MRKSIFSMFIFAAAFVFSGCQDNVVKNVPVADPQLLNFTPTSGGKGTTITISGKDFGSNPAGVSLKINGISASILTVSNTQITATAPPKSGLGVLELTVNGKALTSSEKFRYLYSATTSYFTGGTQGYADGPAKSVRFAAPYNILYDQGFLYLADLGNSMVRKIEADGTVSTIVGQVSSGFKDGKGTQGLLRFPIGIDIGPDGVIYVADSYNHAIRKIATDGTLSTISGSPDQSGYADGTVANAKFRTPYGVRIDKTGVLWVCDSENALIRKIAADGKVTTFAGSTQGFANGKLLDAKFYYPAYLIFDEAGNIFVADKHNHCIRKISSDGMVTTFAGKPETKGWADGVATEAMFDQPSNIQIDKLGNLYVTDLYNQCIRLIYPDGFVTTIAGKASEIGYVEGKGDQARFYYPQGSTLDRDGNLYVTDSYNNRIRKLTIE
jgi:sugar lactone lactonase YvrE